MENTVLLVTVLLMVCISQLIEVYAYLLKGIRSQGMGRQLIGLANWIQYVARIIYVIVLMLLSFMFEVIGLVEEILLVIFLSFVISFVFSVCLCYFPYFRNAFRTVLTPLTVFTYPNLKLLNVIFKLNKVALNYQFFLSLFSSWLIGLAFVLPFSIAAKFPELRMMATYSGQVLNFIATAIIFSKIEPSIFKELDNDEGQANTVCNVAVSVVISKIAAQLLVAITVGIVIVI